jgi:hypothetical protein
VVTLDPYPDPGSRFGSGSRRAKMTHKKSRKVNKFHFLKYWMFSFEGPEGFSCSVDVLYGGLRISKLQFLITKIRIRILEMLNPDPQH